MVSVRAWASLQSLAQLHMLRHTNLLIPKMNIATKSNTKLSNYSPIPRTLSEFFLLSVNILPLFGTWFLNWKLSDIFILYWAESLIIGFYWFVKLATTFILDKNRKQRLPNFIFIFFFFLIHFGGFMFGHLIILMSLIIFRGVQENFDLIFSATQNSLITLMTPLILLFISHGFSFIQNFILKKEYETWIKKSGGFPYAPPYGRIVVMHISVFLIAFLINAGKFLSPLSAILIIFTKIITDLRGHRIEHSK